MSQELSQELIQGGGGGGLTGSTGSICPETSVYKATDGKIEFILHLSAGDPFPPFPGGNGTKKCTWSKLTKAADGNKTSFTSVKVAAGSI